MTTSRHSKVLKLKITYTCYFRQPKAEGRSENINYPCKNTVILVDITTAVFTATQRTARLHKLYSVRFGKNVDYVLNKI